MISIAVVLVNVVFYGLFTAAMVRLCFLLMDWLEQ